MAPATHRNRSLHSSFIAFVFLLPLLLPDAPTLAQTTRPFIAATTRATSRPSRSGYRRDPNAPGSASRPTTSYARPIAPRTMPAWDVRDFGAVADGKTLNTTALQSAIDTAETAGGGMVYVPPGTYLTGTFRIKSNVTLYLEAGATLLGSAQRNDYAWSRLVYAEDASNAAIRGRGTIDGNGSSFFVKAPKENGEGEELVAARRPGRMISLIHCSNFLIDDVTIQNSPAWTIHPIDCDLLTIRGIRLLNGIGENDGPNTDGIDPDSCTRLTISDSYIQAGDDGIVLKVGRRSRNKICRDVTVANCTIVSSETALKIGSESEGEFRNINFSNCSVRDANCAVGIWMRDGGLVDKFVVNNITMESSRSGVPVYIWSWRRTEDTPWGQIKNVLISNLTATADACIFIAGPAEQPIEGVTLENFRLHMRGQGKERPWHVNPKEPFETWGHHTAPYDIFCRNVKDLKLRNIQVTWATPEKPLGSAIRAWGVSDLEIDGFVGRQSLGSGLPAIWLKNLHTAMIRNCRPPAGTSTFLKLDEGTQDVSLMNNDLSKVATVASFAPSVPPAELFQSGNRPSTLPSTRH